MELLPPQVSHFQTIIWDFYAKHGRVALPWRLPDSLGTFDPYKIWLSEMMLQQTQVARVVPKYEAFLRQFPDIQTLAAASLGDVLRIWQGLGYNRRAKFLWQGAGELAQLASFPRRLNELTLLPGIGSNTGAAILAYSFNEPVAFVETNIRTVYIHHFFEGQSAVSDNDILALVRQTLAEEQPREWYWALMDYGSYLKTIVGNRSRDSKHFTRQSTFHGSRRQIRGQVIRLLSARHYSLVDLAEAIPDERLPAVLQELNKEGLIREKGSSYSL